MKATLNGWLGVHWPDAAAVVGAAVDPGAVLLVDEDELFDDPHAAAIRVRVARPAAKPIARFLLTVPFFLSVGRHPGTQPCRRHVTAKFSVGFRRPMRLGP